MQRKSQSFPKNKHKVVVDWLLKASDRSSQRRALAEKWLDEGQYTNYRYNVETCKDGSRVYLLRPTWLNKGFDFQVNVEGFRSRTRQARASTAEMPSHKDVIDDLKRKLKARPDLEEDIYAAVCEVYDCAEPDEVLSRRTALRRIGAGLPADKLLRIVKWLFIEQDLTYWLQTGRNMLMSAMETKVFRLDAPLRK
jgi:hypothetical protein